MTWVRAETNSRACHIAEMLRVLPVYKVSVWYMETLLDDPLIKGEPVLCERIQQILDGVTDEDRKKADEEVIQGEICVVFPWSLIPKKRNNEVRAVRLEHNLDVVTLGTLEAAIPQGQKYAPLTNCCVDGEVMYMVGLGTMGDEVWSFHLTTGKQSLLAK